MEFRFAQFKVYQDGKDLYQTTLVQTGRFSRDFYHLGEQMRRASLSVILNIAEGSGKASDRDFNRYIQNALGSINELAAGYDVARTLDVVSREEYERIEQQLLEVKRQLGGFSKQLRVDG